MRFNTTLRSQGNKCTLYLFFFFFSFLFSFSRSLLAISMTSLASFSGASRAVEKEPGPPYSEERVVALDRLLRRFSLTASLSRSLALRRELLKSHSTKGGGLLTDAKHSTG